MSADKPIQRFKWITENRPVFVCMGCDDDGGWVMYEDHLAAIRNARAEAFEEAAEAAHFATDSECDGDHKWGCNLCHGSHLAEVAIRALAAKERPQ